jgi:predicted nucleotide-binding protein
MKPRIFGGSSRNARNHAEAIHGALKDVAECTVWTEGAFGLAVTTLDNLMKNLHDSDFGAFIFAADDQATINGNSLTVPRDNVVFEAGLFIGYLGPERCFIAFPQKTTR